MKILKFESDDGTVCLGCDYNGDDADVLNGNILGTLSKTGQRKPVKRMLPPIHPSAVFCIGLNYKAHAEETKMALPEYPVVFMKNPAAATGCRDDIVLPSCCAEKPEVDYEAELAVVIKKPVKNVSPEKALDSVLGYTCANDISARRWQKHAGGGQWVKGKSFDTFCPFGPWIVTPDEIGNPDSLDLASVLNGETMQKSNTSDMIFSVGQIISYLSQSATLLPGTLILTGTPSGVGFTRIPPVYLQPGDLLETRIEAIGSLKNRVVSESDTGE